MTTPRLRWALALVSAWGAGAPAADAFAGRAFHAEVACRDVPEAQRDGSALTNPEHLRAVHEIARAGRQGARLVVMSGPGSTAEGLQRIADCHLAWLAASGDAARTARSPLDVKGAAVVVKARGDAFWVDITAVDPSAVRAIRARARALLPRAKSAAHRTVNTDIS